MVSAVWSVVLTTEVRRAEVRSMPDGGARWGYRSAVARREGGLRLSGKAFEKRSRTCRQPVHLGERERKQLPFPCVAASRAGNLLCWPSNAAADWLTARALSGFPATFLALPPQTTARYNPPLSSLARRGQTRRSQYSAHVSLALSPPWRDCSASSLQRHQPDTPA